MTDRDPVVSPAGTPDPTQIIKMCRYRIRTWCRYAHSNHSEAARAVLADEGGRAAMSEKRIGSWARPLAARKLHFFQDGRTLALCGAYMAMRVKPSDFAQGTVDDENARVERCPTCEKIHDRLRAAGEGDTRP